MSFREIFQVVETGPELGNERSFEYAFLLDFAGAVGGELHHFDPGTAKPALRRIRKEQQTHVEGNVLSITPEP